MSFTKFNFKKFAEMLVDAGIMNIKPQDMTMEQITDLKIAVKVCTEPMEHKRKTEEEFGPCFPSEASGLDDVPF